MKEKIMAICDTEPEYSKRLAERMREKADLRYRLQVFTSLSAVLEYHEESEISILITGAEYARAGMLKEVDIEDIYILSDEQEERDGEYPNFYKYQSSSRLIEKISAQIRADKGLQVMPRVQGRKSAKIIGFFSTSNSVEKTVFSVLAGLITAKKEEVLYVNLERYSGFEALFGRTGEKKLSEAMFYLLRDGEGVKDKVVDLLEEYEGLSYLPPIRFAGEFEGLKKDMLPKCIGQLKHLAEEGDISQKTILLEFGGATEGYIDLLKLCDKVCVLYKRDCMSLLGKEQFFSELEACEEKGILRKLEEIELFLPEADNPEKIVAEGIDSSFAKKVRKSLEEGGLID